MGKISDIASFGISGMLQPDGASGSKRSGVAPMVRSYDKKRRQRTNAKSIGGEDSGIHDDIKNDWLSRQLREEAAALKRMREEYGLTHFSSDAQKLKIEHAVQHVTGRVDADDGEDD